MKTPKINIGKLLNQIDNFSEDAKRGAVSVTNATADEIVTNAKLNVTNNRSVDTGQLRLSIGHTQAEIGNNRSMIFANTLYAAYVEFGTGGTVSIPKGFGDIAAKWKGKGIRQINIRPKPYLIPAYLLGINKYTKRLSKLYERLTKQYNNKK